MKLLDLDVADESHLGILLPLVRAYHEFEHVELSDEQRRNGLLPLLAKDSAFGRVWVVRYRNDAVGYIALCFGYSIEFCGRDAFVDEFYLAEEVRGQGIGSAVLSTVKRHAAALGIAALHLEVARSNGKAIRLYSRLGFCARERYHLMSYLVAAGDRRDAQA